MTEFDNYGSNQRPINQNHTAEDVGFKTRQITDGEMDTSWRSRGDAPTYTGIQEAQQGRQELFAALRAIEEIGDLDINDLAMLSINDRDPKIRESARALSKYNGLNENNTRNNRSQPQMSSTWDVLETQARLANSNKMITVYIVEDSLTEMNTGKKYRIRSIAEKVSRVINATNNPNDPRIDMINETYDRHVELVRHRNAMKRSIKEGKNVDKQKLNRLERELQQVNAKLGLN